MVAKEERDTGRHHALEFGVESQERLKLRNCRFQLEACVYKNTDSGL